ncbi:hypothetical protein NI508_000013 [Salmonella enterica]|nr:hypothetical protein [Salmonella enterica]EJJ4477250.1 hypothetical protein [Salmonella enterica]EJJ4620758.1 hypothetical protein [Salmonella enterica]
MTMKSRMTKKKAQILNVFSYENADFIKSEVGGWPLTARDVLYLTQGLGDKDKELDQIRAMRRTLETLVRDGLLVHEDSESYYEVSTSRTIHRKGIAYDLPKALRVGRPAGSEKYKNYGSYDSGVTYFDAKDCGSGRIIEGEVIREHEKDGSLDCFGI